MRLALWQTTSPAGDVEAGFTALAQALAAAAAGGADMLIGPELFLPGYNSPDISDLAQARNGPWTARLASLARGCGCGLSIGYAERQGAQLFNSAITFDAKGHEMAHYRKVQLYGPREKALFAPGETYTVFEFGGMTCGLLICYDIEFSHHVRALAGQGVQLILCPTANMEPYDHVVRFTVPAMAANHAVSLVYANYCGSEGDLDYLGGSLIADPTGEPLVRAGKHPALMIAELPQRPPAARLSTQGLDFRKI